MYSCFILLILFIRVVCAKECSNCQCCAEGQYRKCESSGYCNYGCKDGYYGANCINKCIMQNCLKCDRFDGNSCSKCLEGYYRYNHYCPYCGTHCASCDSTGCQSCYNGFFGRTCDNNCLQLCSESKCEKSNGSCLSCIPGYWGNYCEHRCDQYFGTHCKTTCPPLCKSCDQNGVCTLCKLGYSNEQSQCTCSRNICVNHLDCESCTNTSFFANGGVCCLCSLKNCVSCSKALDTVYCKTCNEGYYPRSKGLCERCNSYCLKKECDSSSGKCIQGCIDGYWNQTCDRECKEECLSCSQANGVCTQCKNNTTYGPYCRMECSATCKNSMCDIKGDCTNGCITNTFGKQCEFRCGEYCSSKENRTVCSEQTGMCLYGCRTGYSGKFCPQAEKQTTSSAALGWGIGGGLLALAATLVVGLISLRRRKVNLSNRSKTPEREPENLSALYATVNRGRAPQGEYANGDSDNSHSITIIETPNYQSPPPRSIVKERMPIFTEDDLEIDEDDASAREIAEIFEENGDVYYNNATEVSKLKKHVADLPEYVHNLCSKDLEEEYQKIPYGLVKAYEVSQTQLNMHKNRYRGIYPSRRDYDTVDTNLPEVELNDLRRRSITEHNDLQNNDIVQDARRDYDTVDSNLREVELNDLRYETLEVNEVHTMDQTADYSSIPEQENDIITYENVFGGL